MNILKPIVAVIILLLLGSCKEKQSDSNADLIGTILDKDIAIQVTMEGKTHTILQKDVQWKAVDFEKDTLELMFRAKDNPFELNLNTYSKDVVNNENATYSLSGKDNYKSAIGLNFLNAEREGRKIDRRIVFNKGTITIKNLSKNQLQMTFEGEAGPMMDFKNKNSFPVSGKVDINY